MMTPLSRVVRSILLIAVFGLITADQPKAEASTHKINAKGVGQDLGGGDTQARIIGGGLLSGTTTAHFDTVGGSLPVLQIAGDVTFATNEGATLTVYVTGSFDISTGDFSASGTVTGAT